MSDRFLKRDGGPTGDDLTRPCCDGAGRLTGRTGHFVREPLGLLSCELFERAACQSARDSGGNLLHLVEVHVEIRSAFAVGVLGDNFPPLLSQFLQRRELFG